MGKYKSQNQGAGRAFEPRRGSILLEQPPEFAGKSGKESGAFLLIQSWFFS